MADARIVADLSGATVHGQVAVGEHIVQIHAEQGAVVNYVAPQQRPRPRLRERPVRRLPRDFPALLGRERELAEVRAGLDAGAPVEVFGETGVGKTALLRHLAHRSGEWAPDGVLHATCRGQPAGDVLQFVFESFYETDVVVVPTPAELAHYLSPQRAFLVLDDLELEREDLQRVLDASPQSRVLTAAAERRLWGEGRSIALAGLDQQTAGSLLERELGRSLSAQERSAAEAFARAVAGHPLRLLQAAALLANNTPPGALGEIAQSPAATSALERLVAASLSERDRLALKPLAAVDAALEGERVSAIADLADAPALLESLQARGVVTSEESRYRLSGLTSEQVLDPEEGDAWRERALGHYVRWCEQEGVDHRERIVTEREPLMGLLSWGAGSQRWSETLRLARSASDAIALAGRWGSWGAMVEHALAAARQTGDRHSEAWALHQLGSRALCLHDGPAASALLQQALQLRDALGDEQGAELSRHNLGRLRRQAGLAGARPPWSQLPPLARILLFVVVGAAGFGAGAAITGGDRDGPTTETVTETETVTDTQTETDTETETVTETETETVTETETSTVTVEVPSGPR